MTLKLEIETSSGTEMRRQLMLLLHGDPTRDDYGYSIDRDLGGVITQETPIGTAVFASGMLRPADEPAKRTRRSKKEDASTTSTPKFTELPADELYDVIDKIMPLDETPLVLDGGENDAKTFTKAEVKSRLTELTLKIGAAPAITFMHTVTGIPKFNDVPDTMYAKLMAALDKKLVE